MPDQKFYLSKISYFERRVLSTLMLLFRLINLFYSLKTSQISNAAYKSEWFTMSIQNKKKIAFIILRGQKPQTLSVGGNNGLVASMLLFSQV